MDINPIANIAASTQAMGQLLQQMSDAKMGFDEKLLQAKAAEIEQVGNIDVMA